MASLDGMAGWRVGGEFYGRVFFAGIDCTRAVYTGTSETFYRVQLVFEVSGANIINIVSSFSRHLTFKVSTSFLQVDCDTNTQLCSLYHNKTTALVCTDKVAENDPPLFLSFSSISPNATQD